MKLLLAALLLMGCSANPLIGAWQGPSITVGGATIQAVVHLNSDGTLVYDIDGSGTCTGTLTFLDYNWSSGPTTLTFSGAPTCSGSITCGASTYNCSSPATMPTLGACDYTLSNGNSTLVTTSCTNPVDDATWTRTD